MQLSEVQRESCNSLQELSQQFWDFLLCKKAHLSSPLPLAWHLAVFKGGPAGHLIFSPRKTCSHHLLNLQAGASSPFLATNTYSSGDILQSPSLISGNTGLAVQAHKRNLDGGGCSQLAILVTVHWAVSSPAGSCTTKSKAQSWPPKPHSAGLPSVGPSQHMLIHYANHGVSQLLFLSFNLSPPSPTQFCP